MVPTTQTKMIKALAEPAPGPQGPHKIETSLVSEKLQKVLAGRGLASRREAERWIAAGRVSVNGKVATLGDRVELDDQLVVDGKPVGRRPPAHRHILYNKPSGQVCSRDDPDHKDTVFDHLPLLKGQRWVSVGRLDINTTGLLIFTTDGALANGLMHPSRQVEREYACRVLGDVTEDKVRRMLTGVELDGVSCRFTDLQAGRGEGANRWYYVVLMQGRNREVRRLWESQGLRVSRLKRVRYGNVFIPSVARVGRWKDLSREEVKGLYELAAGAAAST